MSGIKISELPAAGSANGDMQFEVNDSGTSRRVTATQMKALIAPLANQAEAEAGTEPAKVMTPLQTAQAIDKRTNDRIASEVEAQAGTDSTKLMTPERVAQAIAALTPVPPDALPVGTVIYVAMNTAPAGYLKANGAQVSRSTYAALFAAIGTTFGSGNGSTTFNLPDLRGEFIRGWSDGRSVDSGRAFGSAQSQAVQQTTTAISSVTGSGTSLYGLRLGTDSGGFNLPNNGGAETRPRNVALLAVIKF
jgi:hypothetical protein